MSASLTFAEGRELELAKVVRESLHLVDGDRVSIESTDDGVVLRREADSPRIFQENGHWVFSGGQPSDYSVREIVDGMRDERIGKLGGK